MRNLGTNDIKLIKHHTGREYTKEYRFNQEKEYGEQLGGPIETGRDGGHCPSMHMAMANSTRGESCDNQEEGIGTCTKGVKAKEEKVLVIANTNTIVDPRTVMVHFDDTPIANGTVVRSGWFEGFAAATEFLGGAVVGFARRIEERLHDTESVGFGAFGRFVIGIVNTMDNGLGIWWHSARICSHGGEM